MGNSAATMYGEYIELHQDETSCPSTQPSNNDQQLIDNSNDNPQDDELENGNRENPENKVSFFIYYKCILKVIHTLQKVITDYLKLR